MYYYSRIKGGFTLILKDRASLWWPFFYWSHLVSIGDAAKVGNMQGPAAIYILLYIQCVTIDRWVGFIRHSQPATQSVSRGFNLYVGNVVIFPPTGIKPNQTSPSELRLENGCWPSTGRGRRFKTTDQGTKPILVLLLNIILSASVDRVLGEFSGHLMTIRPTCMAYLDKKIFPAFSFFLVSKNKRIFVKETNCFSSF